MLLPFKLASTPSSIFISIAHPSERSVTIRCHFPRVLNAAHASFALFALEPAVEENESELSSRFAPSPYLPPFLGPFSSQSSCEASFRPDPLAVQARLIFTYLTNHLSWLSIRKNAWRTGIPSSASRAHLQQAGYATPP